MVVPLPACLATDNKTNLRHAPWGSYVVQLDPTFTEFTSHQSSPVGGNMCQGDESFFEGGGVFEHGGLWWQMTGRNGCMDPRGGDVRVRCLIWLGDAGDAGPAHSAQHAWHDLHQFGTTP